MAAPPAMVMPVDESEQQIESLQGHSHTSVLPFLSQDLLEQQSRYRKQQQQQQQQTASSSEKQSEAAAAAPHHQHPPNSGEGGQQRATRLAPPQSLSGTMLQNIPPRSNNTRTNILDYLAWLNLVTRLTSAQQLSASTKKAELASEAFANEVKPHIASKTYAASDATTSSSSAAASTLEDADLADLLKTLPGALSGRLPPTPADDDDEASSPAAAVARASGLERLLVSMLGTEADALQLNQSSQAPLTAFQRQRCNLAVLANQIFGEASSHGATPSSSASSSSSQPPALSHPQPQRPGSNKSKRAQKTVSLHPAVSLVDLPRVILPIVGISTIPQSIMGLAGSSGVPMALLKLKFGGGDNNDQPAEPPTHGPLPLADFPQDQTLPRNPHHDYRIRHTASVHHRAKQIYDKAALKSSGVRPWCARHRVQACSLCHSDALARSQNSLHGRKSRDAPVVPGDGLAYFKDDYLLRTGRRRPLAQSLADFLILAADAFHLMALGSEQAACDNDTASSRREFTPLAGFYDLVVDFVTQAVLEGYTVHGWTGKEALEVLFSVGTGTWEERKWADIPSSWTTPANSMPPSQFPSRSPSPSPDSAESSSASSRSSSVTASSLDSVSSHLTSSSETQAQASSAPRDPREHLIRAATELFRTRTPAQAEFEREMRDRMHEFLDVPEESTLETHLRDLGVKYPLSVFEEHVLSFFTAVESMLGKPALVKNTMQSKTNKSPAPKSPLQSSSTLDVARLEHFASRFSWADLERAAGAGPSSIGKRSTTPPAAEGKRRKT